jgi:hypothetical protein
LPSIKIYDENENPQTMEDITSETNIISILEIQGIKFTSRNFQIEIELKQVMVLNNEPIFDNCLIKPIRNKTPIQEPLENLELKIENETDFSEKTNDHENEELNNEEKTNDVEEPVSILEETNDLEEFNPIEEESKKEENEDLDLDLDLDLDINLDFEDLNEDSNIKEDPNDLREFNLDVNVENNLEKMNLKKPNQVYFELYKEARNKAKHAKKNAILAYLEAKNIKKTYLIDNLNDSDSDFDAEIDEVSESELDNL